MATRPAPQRSLSTMARTVVVSLRASAAGDRAWYAIGAVLILSGCAHLVVQLVVGGPWEGPVSWRKPVTFGLSFGLTVISLAWVSGLLPLPARRRTRLLTVFSAACVLEVAVITIQAWRGVPSHYNLTTPVNTTFAMAAAGGGAVIIVVAALFTIDVWRRVSAPASLLLAVRTGLAVFVIALAVGAAMIAVGVGEARAGHQVEAYTVASALKDGHAATMHAVLVLPFLAWLTGLTEWSERRRRRLVMTACVLYVVISGGIVVISSLAVGEGGATGVESVNAVLGTVGIVLVGALFVRVLLGVRDATSAAPVRAEGSRT